LIFYGDWFHKLKEVYDGIVSPVTNNFYNPEIEGRKIPRFLDLEDYYQNQEIYDYVCAQTLVNLAQAIPSKALLPTFSCVKISYSTLEAIGPLDQSFKNGGEDADFVLRAHLAAIPCYLHQGAYVLHFGGQLTWSQDSNQSALLGTDQRLEDFGEHRQPIIDLFVKKWGTSLAQVFLGKIFLGKTEDIDFAQDSIKTELKRLGIAPPPIQLDWSTVEVPHSLQL
jgi:GT2 family glycosyltransferase